MPPEQGGGSQPGKSTEGEFFCSGFLNIPYLKARAKRGLGVCVGTRGGTGEGVARIVRGLESSKHVIATLDEESGVLTVQRI